MLSFIMLISQEKVVFMFRFIILSLVLLPIQLSAVMYSDSDIKTYQYKKASSQDFIRKFFIDKDPEAYIDNFLSENKNSMVPIVLESMLYSLLNEVAYHPKQEFLQTFVNQMKEFNVQAMRMHNEGRLPVAIYNINAKAKGIENIWLADESLNYYQTAFANSPVETLKLLRHEIKNLKTPQWLGLKRSLKTLDDNNQSLIANYLIADAQNRVGLDKFVSYFALMTEDENLIEASLKTLDKSNSEYVLRNLNKHFSFEFVVSQLIDTVNSHKNQQFAISMMTSYLDEPLVQKSLMNYLSNEKLATSAAIALTQIKEVRVINQLEDQYDESNSLHTKKQIIFTLQMNQMTESKTALNRITKKVDGQSKSSEWLNSFKGESK